VLYANRNAIERLIGWLKECCRLTNRYEKYALCSLAVVKLPFVRLCFRGIEFSDTD